MLPVFVRVLEALSDIHKARDGHPVLRPEAIHLLADGSVSINTMPLVGVHSTRVLPGKYSSFEELSESADGVHKPESDVYVLGFIFYEIILGKDLFNACFAELQSGNPDFAWLNWHCDPARTARPISALLPSAPSLLSNTIENMMSKDASQRPATAEAAQALGTVLEQLARQTFAEAPTVRVRRKRSRAPVRQALRKAATALLVLALVGGGLAAAAWLVSQNRISEVTSVPNPETPEAIPEAPAAEAAALTDIDLPAEIDSGTGIMVLIPETEFEMGSDGGLFNGDVAYENETPPHKVRVPAFYIDKHEVTNRFYKEFCDATGRKYPPNPSWDDRYFDKPDHPVMNVSWSDAQAYATWAGKRLASEAEWELAARGPNGNAYPWGNEYADNAANLTGSGDGSRYTAAVGSFRLDVSPFGIADMAGNVSEWVRDLYALYPGNPGQLLAGENMHRVVRGAGMTYGRQYARLTRRMSHAPELTPGQHTAIGFRCSSDVQTIRNAYLKSRTP